MKKDTLLPPKLAGRTDSFRKSYDRLASRILAMCDLADEQGATTISDRVSALAPKLALLRVAQYEGFTNYWIANGRAFEMAYKDKASKPGASPHEAWWAVLEEYQEGLEGNQSSFNEKYAFKQADKEASAHLLETIIDNVEKHGSPSVAIYQAIHDVSTGKTIFAAMQELSDVIAEAEKDESLSVAARELSDAAQEAVRTAGVMDWMGRGLNWLGKAFDPIAEGVERMEMGYMGAGGPLVDAGVKIRQQAEKIYQSIRWVRTQANSLPPGSNLATISIADFGTKMLGPIRSPINILSMMAQKAGIKVPGYNELVSYLGQSGALTPENVEAFASAFASVFKITENQALLEKIYQSYKTRGKVRDFRRRQQPAPGPAPDATEKAPSGQNVGPEFVGNFMGAVEKIKGLTPQEFNALRSIVNHKLLKSKEIRRPQGIGRQRAASVIRLALDMDTFVNDVMSIYRRLQGNPLLDDSQIAQLKQSLAAPEAPSEAAPATTPIATTPPAETSKAEELETAKEAPQEEATKSWMTHFVNNIISTLKSMPPDFKRMINEESQSDKTLSPLNNWITLLDKGKQDDVFNRIRKGLEGFGFAEAAFDSDKAKESLQKLMSNRSNGTARYVATLIEENGLIPPTMGSAPSPAESVAAAGD